MSKGILLVFILSLLIIQKDKSSTFKINSTPFEWLNGRVKQLVEISQYCLAGKTSENSDTTYFDKDGNQTITLSDRMSNDRIVKYGTKCDKSGKKIESNILSNNGQSIYEYDSVGHIVKSWFKDKNNKEKFQTTYKYDGNGRMIEKDYILSTNYGLQRLFLKYDNNNQLIETDLFSGKNRLVDKSLFQYQSFDSKNNWTKRIRIGEFKGPISDLLRRDTSILTRKITYY